MRITLLMGLVLSWGVAGCFEDAKPVDEGGEASSGSECVAGTEGCPCIDGECVGGLSCLSNTCVDTGETSVGSTTTATSTTSMSGMSTISTSSVDSPEDGSVDSTPDDTTPVSDGPPPMEQCDPFDMGCGDGMMMCHAVEGEFICEFPGGQRQGGACFPFECSWGLACVPVQAFDDCMAEYGCCTNYCDLFDPDQAGLCQADQVCVPVFGFEIPPPPGYEHVGACVTNEF